MKKISISALDSLFNYINKPSNIFWLRDKSYKKQIYISPSFEEVWGIPCAHLYNDTAGNLIKSTLLEEGAEEWMAIDKIKKRIAADSGSEVICSETKSEFLLRIKTQQGVEKYLNDANYLLIDDNGQHLGFAGIAQVLSREEWLAKLYAEKCPSLQNSSEQLKKHIFDMLYKETGLIAVSNTVLDTDNKQHIPQYYIERNQKKIIFTQREAECLHYLKHGKSAKQTADILNISPRTVEFHIGNACEKANCRSKLELLSKVKAS